MGGRTPTGARAPPGSGGGSGGSGGGPTAMGPQRCRLVLQRCLAIQLSKPGTPPDDFWMYDSGYMLFQSFLAANSQCWWNTALVSAARNLRYSGHVAPGFLLVTADPCALEIVRGAYARRVLKPPPSYVISGMGDIDDCVVAPVSQGQFTPLPEALCDVIMELTATGQSASQEAVRNALTKRFPNIQTPTPEIVYDTLAQLTLERKIYQTSRGYFIVTPERRRSRSHSRRNPRTADQNESHGAGPLESRTVLLSTTEAVHSLYGEITTIRDGDLTHQCIQTNLADVICGGNPSDKVMYARRSVGKSRSGSFPCSPRSLERRHSLRLFGSSKRLQRCASTRSLSKAYAQHYQHHHNQGQYATDSSSSEYHSADSTSPKKTSLLSRLFRRSTRCGKGREQIKTFSAQFPPAEWFNSKTVHLHCVATQTNDKDATRSQQLSQSTFYDSSECSNSHRSSSLPRRHHRRHLSSESAILISSRDHSPIRRKSPLCYSGSLPRSSLSVGHPKHGKSLRQARGSEDVEDHKSSHDSGPSSLGAPCSGPSSLESQQSTATLLSSPKRVATPYRSPRHTSSSRSTLKPVTGKPPREDSSRASEDTPKSASGMPPSKSNNSITLQVTTSNTNQHNGGLGAGNTKIFVQNSPVRSVITFENDNLTENSNVYVLNKETVNGETSHSFTRSFGRSANSNVELRTADSEKQDCSAKNEGLRISGDKTNMNKNCNNDIITMNNSRKLSLQLPNNSSTVGSLNYKNMLKNEEKIPTSPTVNKNVLSFDNTIYQVPNKSHDNITGSAGNLLFEKNAFDVSGKLVSKLKSNSDLKQSKMYMGSGDDLIKKTSALNSNPNLSNYYTAYQSRNTLSKNNTDDNDPITAGSEPNLTLKNLEANAKVPIKVQSVVSADRRLSLSRENAINTPDLVNFPSFNDLSFNFTSLAAQKILKGVSINSIDTLVELNMAAAAKDKHNNCELSPVCTDFGLV